MRPPDAESDIKANICPTTKSLDEYDFYLGKIHSLRQVAAVTSASKVGATVMPEHRPGEHDTSVLDPTIVTVLVDCEHAVEIAVQISTTCTLYSVKNNIFLNVVCTDPMIEAPVSVVVCKSDERDGDCDLDVDTRAEVKADKGKANCVEEDNENIVVNAVPFTGRGPASGMSKDVELMVSGVLGVDEFVKTDVDTP